MKNLEAKPGWLNRHIDGIPDKVAIIKIITKDYSGEHQDTCKWTPFNKDDYNESNMPSPGYLGTARVLLGISIGFHAWEQNNSEFVYYKYIE